MLPAKSSATRILLVGLGGLAVSAGALLVRGQDDPTRVAEPVEGKAKLPTYYVSTIGCKNCHNENLPNFPPGVEATPYICRGDEFAYWSTKDKHSLATKVLAEPRAKAMGRLIWNDEDVTGRKECLSCHGVYVEPEQRKTQLDPFFQTQQEGVTCVSCHGAHLAWVREHVQPGDPLWQGLNREEKERTKGMTDLWDPVTRTRTCVSCHIGNLEEGKFLTHQMYAAGHPPLPGFETAVFSDQEPRHWDYLREKSPIIQKRQDFDETERERAKLLVVGQVVAFREALNLLADDARDKAAAQKAEDQALDLTHFDCYACHHDLKIPGWRQRRGFIGSAGRPQPRPWPTALMRLALRADSADDDAYRKNSETFAALLKAYRQPFEDRPFGDPAAVSPPTRALVDWLDGLTARLKTTTFDVALCKTLLHEVGDTALDETPDFDSARQLSWAFDVLWSELEPVPSNAEEVEAILRTLRTEMRLNLPAGTKEFILNDLPANLDAVALYDPKVFQARMTRLIELLPAE